MAVHWKENNTAGPRAELPLKVTWGPSSDQDHSADRGAPTFPNTIFPTQDGTRRYYLPHEVVHVQGCTCSCPVGQIMLPGTFFVRKMAQRKGRKAPTMWFWPEHTQGTLLRRKGTLFNKGALYSSSHGRKITLCCIF